MPHPEAQARRSRRGVGVQFTFSAESIFCAFAVHPPQHEICPMATGLEADVYSFKRITRRGPPWPGVMLAAAADHHASPVAAANPECALFYRRQNHEAFSLVQQILGNVIWNVENLFQNFA